MKNIISLFMRKLILITISLFVIQINCFGQRDTKRYDDEIVFLDKDSISLQKNYNNIIPRLEIPKTYPYDIIITHTGYSLLYNEIHEQANWVAYNLTKEETIKRFERNNKFILDPKVKTGTANDKDYKGSGYDRGHLAPAADMAFSEVTMLESFYYSNMSPQLPGFNRGVWKRLEELVRTWAFENNNIYIVTGPILTKVLSTIGPNNVSVPNYYYKVILDYTYPSIKGIGFILPNNSSSSSLQSFAVSIDIVEKYTGIDFFPMLPDDQEEVIEKTLCVSCWTWKSSKSENTSKDKLKASKSVQCKGIAKSGNRCKKRTLSLSGYCYLHESQSYNSINNSEVNESKTEQQTGTTATGIPTYTGPRGGIYHYSKSGKKIYSKKK